MVVVGEVVIVVITATELEVVGTAADVVVATVVVVSLEGAPPGP